MKHKLSLIYAWLVRIVLFSFPDIPPFMRLRGWLYGLAMTKCGRNFQITHSAIINGLDLCTIGNDVYIANGCNLILNGELTIGSEVILGPGVLVSTGNHVFDGKSFRFTESEKEKICIGMGSWIGGNSTIVGGVNIPDHSVIGAGSVVTRKSCQSVAGVYAGVPAKLIKVNHQ